MEAKKYKYLLFVLVLFVGEGMFYTFSESNTSQENIQPTTKSILKEGNNLATDPYAIKLTVKHNDSTPDANVLNWLPSSKYPKIKNNDVSTQAKNARIKGIKRWKSIAPGFMNVPINVVANGNLITVGIDIGGLLQSKDAGKTWDYISYNAPDGLNNHVLIDFDISPKNNNNIIVATRGGIYSTEDAGLKWNEVTEGLPSKRFLTKSTYYGQVKYNADGSRIFSGIGSLWYYDSKKLPKSIYKYHPHKELYVSKNDGKSFITYEIPNSKLSNLKRIYPHPGNPNIVFFSFKDGKLYATFNAKADNVVLKKIKIPNGYFVRDMTVDPNNAKKMLFLLSSTKKKRPLLYFSDDSTNPQMILKEFATLPYRNKDMLSIGFNPNKPDQVVIGETRSRSLIVSNDRGKSFQYVDLPKKLKHNKLPGFYSNIETVYFPKNASYAIVASHIGLWKTEDNFKSFKDLTMQYKNGWFSNKGVGSPANINSIAITDNNTYFSAQDHGVWKSNGKNTSQWIPLTGTDSVHKFPEQEVPWGSYTWVQKAEKVFASKDDKIVIFNALKYKSRFRGFKKDKKFFRSKDQGRTWDDITVNFKSGEIYPGGSSLVKIKFNDNNSDEFWVLFSNKLYYTKNGGNNLKKLDSSQFPKITPKSKIEFTDIDYDDKRNILYLSIGNIDSNFKKLNSNETLFRSFNKGKEWTSYDINQYSIKSLAVVEDGSLVVGTSKVADMPAYLLTIPYKFTHLKKSFFKLTYGDTIQEISACGMQFRYIKSYGKYVLAYADINWLNSDKMMPQGPFLSKDYGKTFEFIQYDLPQKFIWSADIKNGVILLGTTFGLMEYNIK